MSEHIIIDLRPFNIGREPKWRDIGTTKRYGAGDSHRDRSKSTLRATLQLVATFHIHMWSNKHTLCLSTGVGTRPTAAFTKQPSYGKQNFPL